VEAFVGRRGPDFLSCSKEDMQEKLETPFIYSSVLHLSGEKITQQPLKSTTTQSMLQFNGEIFELNIPSSCPI